MQLNVAEYLKEEALILPDQSQVNAFLSDVDTLRADAERLEARIARLKKTS
jgi:ubiquinone biosynthesis protein UbiJ